MKKILLFISIFFSLAGFAQPRKNMVFTVTDTVGVARIKNIKILWEHAGVDTLLYYFNGTYWQLISSPSSGGSGGSQGLQSVITTNPTLTLNGTNTIAGNQSDLNWDNFKTFQVLAKSPTLPLARYAELDIEYNTNFTSANLVGTWDTVQAHVGLITSELVPSRALMDIIRPDSSWAISLSEDGKINIGTEISGFSYKPAQIYINADSMPGAAPNVLSFESDGRVTRYASPAGGGGSVTATAPLIVSGSNVSRRFNIRDYGAVGNGVARFDAAITSSDATLTSATAAFVVGDVGKRIIVVGAGTSGQDLRTTIASINSGTSVELTATASTTVTGELLLYGTDDTGPIQDAIDAANAAGGGEVFIPNGIYIIDGALTGMNCQLEIPAPVTAFATTRTNITIKGESAPNYTQYGALVAGNFNTFNGSTLVSTQSTGASGAAVIGTIGVSGTFGNYNYTFLTVENLAIKVLDNPAGAGPVIGGINYKFGAAVIAHQVAITSIGAAQSSVVPTNDVSGIETPNVSSETMTTLTDVMTAGFKNGYTIGEHAALEQVQAFVCYRGFNFKTGYHAIKGGRICAQWCTNDTYFSGAATVDVQEMDNEYMYSALSGGKWYDNIYTVNDSLNLGAGNIRYTLIQANVGKNNPHFVKNGATGIYSGSNDDGFAYLTRANVFTGGEQTLRSSTNAWNIVDQTGSTYGGYFIQRSGVTKWSMYMDVPANGTNDFNIRDQANGAARLYFGTAGTGGLGGVASSATDAAIWFDNSNNVSFDNGSFYYDATNNNVSIGGSGAAPSWAGLEVEKANPYLVINSPTSRQGSFGLQYNGTNIYQLGMDWTNNGSGTFYIYDQANTAVRMYINGGNMFLGGTATNPQDAVISFNANNSIGMMGTVTTAGTTGAQTISKPSGAVNFAAGATTLVVTNALATTTSNILVQVYGTDATATSARVTRASGSFTITLNAAATAETAVGFFIFNTQ